jgi:hypothetical protein
MELEALTSSAYANIPLWVVYPATAVTNSFYAANTAKDAGNIDALEVILHRAVTLRVYGYLGCHMGISILSAAGLVRRRWRC